MGEVTLENTWKHWKLIAGAITFIFILSYLYSSLQSKDKDIEKQIEELNTSIEDKYAAQVNEMIKINKNIYLLINELNRLSKKHLITSEVIKDSGNNKDEDGDEQVND